MFLSSKVALVAAIGALTVAGILAKPQQQQQQQSAPTSTSSQSNAPMLENPAYDPTLYQQFLPQDAVQQYVQSYTGGHGNGNYQGYAAIPSKGYEAFLIPAAAATALAQSVEDHSMFGSLRSVVPTGRTLVSFFSGLASIVFGSAGAVVLGTLLTALLCFVTPFCTLQFRNAKIQEVSETAQGMINAIGEQVTAERVKRAAEFVQVAIEKFQHLNRAVKEGGRKAIAGGQ